MYNGIINVYKEAGFTSFDVVAKLRGILKQKKIGHTGTLDPLAEGVLVVCLGNATKLVDTLTSKDKEYEVTMQFGIATDTDDITGKIIKESDLILSEEEISDSIISFVGTYMQLPPMYSAIKIDGKKLYEYAREGKEVERQLREVTIYSIDNIKIDYPYASFLVHCSKGTYIRSLCRDIGEKLGSCATMKSLLRSKVNDITLADTFKLSDIERLRDENNLSKCIAGIDSLLSNYPAITVNEESIKYIINGNKLNKNHFNEVPSIIEDEQIFRVYIGEQIKALYTYNKKYNEFKPYKMFLD